MNILNLDYKDDSFNIPEFKRAMNVKDGYKRSDFQICKILNVQNLSANIQSTNTKQFTFFGWSLTTPFDGRSFILYGDINFTISSRNRLNIIFPEISYFKPTLIVGPKIYSKHQTNSFFQGIRVEKILLNSIYFTLTKEFVSEKSIFDSTKTITLLEHEILDCLDLNVITPITTSEIITKIIK
jgi:hypothetical protein